MSFIPEQGRCTPFTGLYLSDPDRVVALSANGHQLVESWAEKAVPYLCRFVVSKINTNGPSGPKNPESVMVFKGTEINSSCKEKDYHQI